MFDFLQLVCAQHSYTLKQCQSSLFSYSWFYLLYNKLIATVKWAELSLRYDLWMMDIWYIFSQKTFYDAGLLTVAIIVYMRPLEFIYLPLCKQNIFKISIYFQFFAQVHIVCWACSHAYPTSPISLFCSLKRLHFYLNIYIFMIVYNHIKSRNHRWGEIYGMCLFCDWQYNWYDLQLY